MYNELPNQDIQNLILFQIYILHRKLNLNLFLFEKLMKAKDIGFDDEDNEEEEEEEDVIMED